MLRFQTECLKQGPRGDADLATDAQDRPTQACGVDYLPRQAGGAGLPPTLTCADTQQRFAYTYENDADRVGRGAAAP